MISSKNRTRVSRRAILFGLILNPIFTIVNSYFGINFGLGFSYTLIVLMLVYFIFHKRGGSSPDEALTVLISSTGFFMAWTLAIAVYIEAYDPNADLPNWFVPPKEVLYNGSMFDKAWFVPILVHFFITFTAIFLGVVLAYAVHELVLRDRRLTFPYAKVNAVLINTFFEKGGKIKLLATWIFFGFLLTLTQYLLKLFGLETLEYDFTKKLPYGYSFGILVNLSIVAISYIIDPPLTLTILFGGIFYYFLIAPIFVKEGYFQPADNAYDYYFNMLFQFSLSPGLGAFILSAPIIFALKWFKSKFNKEDKLTKRVPVNEDTREFEANLINFAKEIYKKFVERRMLGLSYIFLLAVFTIFAVVFKIFYPLQIYATILLCLLFLVPIAIIYLYILVRMMGEVGITFGSHRLIMYNGLIFASGYRGYLGQIAYPLADPWMGSALIYWFKIGEETKTDKFSIIVSFFIRLIPVYLISVIFLLATWYYIGIPSKLMPSISIIQYYAIIRVFASGRLGTLLNPIHFILGGLISGLLSAFTPISPIGIGLILMLPSTYIVPFGVGGLIRLLTDKKFGREWYEKKGQYIASGFLMGSVLTQIIMSILIL